MSDEMDAGDKVQDLLEEIADALDLDAEVEVEVTDEEILGRLVGDDLGLFIGRHGSTIDAVQHLAFKVAGGGAPGGPRVVIDAAGYRARRTEALHRLADEAADDALKGGAAVHLEPMSATERKVVHEHLKTRTDLRTYSEGREPQRFLVVAPAEE